MKSSRNTALIFALGLPLLVITLSVFATFLPSHFVSPAHDFLYSVSGGSGYYNSYTSYHVENGKLVKDEYPPVKTDQPVRVVDPVLYVYHVSSDTSERVSYEAITSGSAHIVPGVSSDGYEVFAQDQGPNDVFGFLFGGYRRDPNSAVIKSKFFSRKISLPRDSSNYYYPQILGWLE